MCFLVAAHHRIRGAEPTVGDRLVTSGSGACGGLDRELLCQHPIAPLSPPDKVGGQGPRERPAMPLESGVHGEGERRNESPLFDAEPRPRIGFGAEAVR